MSTLVRSLVGDDPSLGDLPRRILARAGGNPYFVEELVRSLVDRHRAGENHDERIWALVNFEIWQRRFFDGSGSNG